MMSEYVFEYASEQMPEQIPNNVSEFNQILCQNMAQKNAEGNMWEHRGKMLVEHVMNHNNLPTR